MERLLASTSEQLPNLIEVQGGHMLYDKCITTAPDGSFVFIKAHNDTLFTQPEAAAHTLSHLRREAEVYDVLRTNGYSYLPEQTFYDSEHEILYMSAQLAEDGWQWDLPESSEQKERYISDVFEALNKLESIDANILPHGDRQPSLDELYAEGWQKLSDSTIRYAIFEKLDIYEPLFHAHVHQGIRAVRNLLIQDPAKFQQYARGYIEQPRTAVGHFDARQSNIAWHPTLGARLVDWSWASPTIPCSDQTMFIIDIFKSGYDVSALTDTYFDPRHALLQIGHWLVRSSRVAPSGDQTVRFHQLASAVSAATLLG